MLVIAGRADQDQDQDATGALVQAVGNTLTSEHSRRAYGAAVWAFLNWYRAAGRRCFDAATVEAWKVKLCGDGLSAAAVGDVVRLYSAQAGVPVAAHDLRRTFAKLAYRNGAPIDQVQLSLGHQSIVTTQRYLGTSQDLQNAPCDRLGLSL